MFDVLPEKAQKYEEYLRDVQTEVLDKWFHNNREEKDVVIKMNTGSGKTVVALLILKTSLNENKGPAVYVVPDKYLVQQVIKEAIDLGISVTENANDHAFSRGEKILITTIQKVINGRSVFGVDEVKKEIGTIIIDDAHACLNIAESQFTLEIKRETETYKELLELFRDSIKSQSEVNLLDLDNGERYVNQLIPFWDWKEKITDVTKILNSKKDNEEPAYSSLLFNWPLLKDNLVLCNCVFGGDAIEISSDHIPIHKIPSFDSANRRIFMSATIDDDSILVSHFNVDHTKIKNSITPNSSNDIGERMILIPQELNIEITDNELKSYYKNLSHSYNVVILVPSDFRSRYWSDVADLIVKSHDLETTINKLKNGHVGLVIIVNKYDGIDLPKNACSILVIDGIPDVRRKINKYEQNALRGSELLTRNIIQRIEQGMGRGIRSKDDYCIVFLMGTSLIDNLYVKGAIEKFTPATLAQINLSRQLAKQLGNASLPELDTVVQSSLKRNKDWVSASRGALVKVKYNNTNTFNDRIILEREAYNKAIVRDYSGSVIKIQEIVNGIEDKRLKAYYKFKLAKYEQFVDPVKAQQTLLSAVRENTQLLHPIEGIQYSKIIAANIPQVNKLNEFLVQNYSDTNKYIISMKKILENLSFRPNSSNQFEQAVMDLGFHLGFWSQRPENDFNKGPDNLWALSATKYLVIECKNEATVETISKHYCNQLNGSFNWFKNTYTEFNEPTPILIHPSNKFEYAASPERSIRIINQEKLDKLKNHAFQFAQTVASSAFDTTVMDSQLKYHNFTEVKFVEEYTVEYI